MSLIKKYLPLLISLSLGICIGLLIASFRPHHPGPMIMKMSPEERVSKMVNFFTQYLDLNPDQVTQFKVIIAEEEKGMVSRFEEIKKNAKRIHEEKMKPILNDEQWEKLLHIEKKFFKPSP